MNSTATPSAPAHAQGVGEDPAQSRGHLGWIVAGSLATGLVAALLLAACPVHPGRGDRHHRRRPVRVRAGLGDAGRAVDAVHRPAPTLGAAPALFMGLGGLLLVVFGSSVHEVLSWVWPPALLALVVWMVIRDPPAPAQPGRTLAALPGVRDARPLRRRRRLRDGARSGATPAYPMPGQLIDVGGHRLHLNCTGSGSPTVVLEPGAGAMSSNLGWIAPAVARDTRVCVYDRAGRGWSDPADTPQDGAQIATDLHTLLHRGRRPRPLRAGRPLLRRPVRAHLRRPLPRRGRRAWSWWTPPHRRRRTNPATASPTTRAPTTSWAESPPWSRLPPGSDWPGCTHVLAGDACRRSPKTR